MDFTEEQIHRYARHILLQEVGGDGQEKLLNAKVLVIGAGGLGSPVILYLAAAGVGNIGVVDDDTVDLSNLQRQIVHTTDRIGIAKTTSAREAVVTIN
ncbi:MAG TPA: adenylyltransferase, partial [Rhodospirillaceae bacterium]|nr:adenylyltransferase [Rhodospirillaceae bacterium]